MLTFPILKNIERRERAPVNIHDVGFRFEGNTAPVYSDPIFVGEVDAVAILGRVRDYPTVAAFFEMRWRGEVRAIVLCGRCAEGGCECGGT